MTTMTTPQTADDVRTDIARTRVALGDTASALLKKMDVGARFRGQLARARYQVRDTWEMVPKNRADFMRVSTNARRVVMERPRITAALLGAGAVAAALLTYTRLRSH